MNVILIVAVFTVTKLVSSSSLQEIPPYKPSINSTGTKSQDQSHSLTRVKEIPKIASEQPVPLEIFLPLSAAKWGNVPDAHLTIFRIVPSKGVKVRMEGKGLGRLAGKIKQSVKRWSDVCNKTSPRYTAVLDTTHDSVSAMDNGIISFIGPITGLLQYIHSSMAKQLPKGWELDLGEYKGVPVVDIGRNDIESMKALFQEGDIRFVVFDFSTFGFWQEGDKVSYLTSFN